MLEVVGHDPLLLPPPRHREIVPQEEQVVDLNVRVLLQDVRLAVVLVVAEIPPM